MAIIITTTQQEFEDQVLHSSKPVLVDFWAAWCPPCRAMEPVLRKIAANLDGKADIVKLNIEDSTDNMRLANEYRVQGIPNMQIFHKGKVAQELIGLQPQAVVETALAKLV